MKNQNSKIVRQLRDIEIEAVEFKQQTGSYDTFQLGIVAGEPNEFYHSCPCVSASTLKRIDTSIELYGYREDEKDKSKDLQIGTAFHTLVLEPKRFDNEYAIIPLEWRDKRTREFKAFKKGAIEDGKIYFIDYEDYNLINRMRNRLLKNKACKSLLKKGFPELTFRTQKLQNHEFGAKCRPDWFNPFGSLETAFKPVIVDLKTTKMLSDDGHEFKQEFIKYKYYFQPILYKNVVNSLLPHHLQVEQFIFIVCSKSYPYNVKLYKLDREGDVFAIGESERLMNSLSKCIRDKKFAVPDINIHELSLPRYITERWNLQ